MTELTLREIRLKLGMTMDEMAEVINVYGSLRNQWRKNKCQNILLQKTL